MIHKNCLFLILSLFASPSLLICDQPHEQGWWCCFFGQHDSYETPDVNGITIDDYIVQLRYDLNGSDDQNDSTVIPSKDTQGIEYRIRHALKSHKNLTNSDYVNQIIRSAIIDQSVHGAEQHLSVLQQTYPIDLRTREAYIFSYRNNMSARLERMAHLNGEALAEFFGAPQKDHIYQHFAQQYNHSYKPNQPKPSAPTNPW